MIWFSKKEESKGFRKLIDKHAIPAALEPALIAALIMGESRGNPWAVRYEPAFYDRYLKLKDVDNLPGYFPAGKVSFRTETNMRACSFGLMQIMGETAREFGYRGIFLTELCEPEANIIIGIKILKAYIEKTGGDINAGLLRYNGGSNANYPNYIRAFLYSGEYLRVYC